MDTNRRNFLTALGAGVAAVTEVAAAGTVTVAEVKVEALPKDAVAYVLYMGRYLDEKGCEYVHKAWNEAFAAHGIKAPLVVVLEPGAKLERLIIS